MLTDNYVLIGRKPKQVQVDTEPKPVLVRISFLIYAKLVSHPRQAQFLSYAKLYAYIHTSTWEFLRA